MPGSESLQLVLVHGLWHDGSVWDAVARELRRLGHSAIAPTVAGHGPGGDRKSSLEQGVASIAAAVQGSGFDAPVLVGHSFGGVIISRVAEELKGRIRRLVYSSAIVPRAGEAVMDHFPEPVRAALPALTGPDGGVAPLPFEVWREAFIADADEALARRAHAALTPYPERSHSDRVELRSFESLRVPKSYLLATEDVALPPGPGDGSSGWHPRFSSRLGAYRLVSMAGGHEVATSAPARMAAKLIEAGRD